MLPVKHFSSNMDCPKCFKKAVHLNPKDQKAIDALKNLENK